MFRTKYADTCSEPFQFIFYKILLKRYKERKEREREEGRKIGRKRRKTRRERINMSHVEALMLRSLGLGLGMELALVFFITSFIL